MPRKTRIIIYTVTAALILWLIVSNVFYVRINQYLTSFSPLMSEGPASIEYYSEDHLESFELLPGKVLCLPVRFEGRLVRIGVYMGKQADSSDKYVFQLEDEYGSILGKLEKRLSDIVENEFVYIQSRSVISTDDNYFIRIFSKNPSASTDSLWINVSLADSFQTDSFVIQGKDSGYTLVLDKRYQAINGQILLYIDVILISATAALWFFSSDQIRGWLKKTLIRSMQAIQWKWVNLIVIILLLLTDIALPFFPKVQYISQFRNSKTYEGYVQVLPLDSNVVVEQHIPAVRGTVDTLEVLFGTYTQDIKGGVVYIELWDDGINELIYRGRVATEQIKDNEYQRFQFPIEMELSGSPLRIRMWAEYETSGNCVAIYLNEAYSENMFAEKNDEPFHASLIFDLSRHIDVHRVRESVIITGGFLVLTILYAWNFLQIRWKLVRYTLCAVLSAVLLFAPLMSFINYSEISINGIAAALPIRWEELPIKQYGEKTLMENLSVEKEFDFAGNVLCLRERTELPVNGMIRSISLNFSGENMLLKDYDIKIYWDTGSGYNDKQIYVYHYIHQGKNSTSFQIPCNEIVRNILVSCEIMSSRSYTLPERVIPLVAVEINAEKIASRGLSVETLLTYVGICMAIIAIGLWRYFRVEEKLKEQIAHRKGIMISAVFVIIATVYGLLLSFLIPTGHVPDEGAHIEMLYEDLGNLSMLGDLRGALGDQGLDGVMFFPGKPVEFDRFAAAAKNHIQDYDFHYSLSLRVLRRPGQALGVMIGQLLHLPAYWILQLGELGALAVYIATGALTLKIIPFKKNLMMIIMLLPVVIQEASSFAYDSFNNALAFLTIAYILYLKVCAEKVGWKQVFALAVLAVGLLVGKVVYVLLLGLVFVVPLRKLDLKFGRSKTIVINETWIRQHRVRVIVFLLVGLCACAAGSFMFLERLGYGEIGKLVLGYLASFSQLLRLLVTTVLVHWKTWMKGLTCYLGWMDVPASELFMWFVVVSVCLTAVMHHGKAADLTTVQLMDSKFSGMNKVVWYGVFVAIFVAVLMSMIRWGGFIYGIDGSLPLSDSMRLLPRIEGVQGRYFFPILPLLLIPIHTRRDVLSFIPAYMYKIVYYAIVVIYPVSLLLVRYWGFGHW